MQLWKEKILINLYCEKKKKNQAALFITEKYKTDSNIYIATK